jgi:hypothetical protein
MTPKSRELRIIPPDPVDRAGATRGSRGVGNPSVEFLSMEKSCALKINDRGPARRIVLTGPDGQSLVAPPGEYRVTFEPNGNTLVFVDGEVRFAMPRAMAEGLHRDRLLSGRLPNDNAEGAAQQAV